MDESDKFERVLASLNDVALSRMLWWDALALIDELIAVDGGTLVFGEGENYNDIRIYSAWMYREGERQRDVEEEYFSTFHRLDERIPRLRVAPDSQLFHVTEFYTPEELKTSPAFNDFLVRHKAENGINVRMDAPGGSRLVWGTGNPLKRDDWSSPQQKAIRRLLPHVRHAFVVQHALASAGVFNLTLLGLLETNGIGVIQLDRNGRILETNVQARKLLISGKLLFDSEGALYARSPIDNAKLQQMLSSALPVHNAQGVGGSMMMALPQTNASLLLHLHPVGDTESEIRSRPVAALLLIMNPIDGAIVDIETVASALNLTEMESQIAVLLTRGNSVNEIAAETGRKESTIRHHLKNVFTKHRLARQSDLVRLVLALNNSPQLKK